MRRFHLLRTTDVTGVSGTGVVAHGCQFPDGTTVIRWNGQHPSTVVWARIEDALHVHGHAGSTQVRWLDDPEQAMAELDPATVWIVPRQEAEPGWVTEGRVNLMSLMNADMSPAEARTFAASYLAAADEAERTG